MLRACQVDVIFVYRSGSCLCVALQETSECAICSGYQPMGDLGTGRSRVIQFVQYYFLDLWNRCSYKNTLDARLLEFMLSAFAIVLSLQSQSTYTGVKLN